MIIKITNKCRMNCSHCMMNSTPDGEHMSLETFQKAIKFIEEINPAVLMIGGGEPTEHPDFNTMLEVGIKLIGKKRLVVASNGMFLEDVKMTKYLKDKNVNVQITNDERFYPISIRKIKHKKFMYEHNIRQVTNHGRAKVNGIADKTVKPKCYNMISVAKATSSLKECIGVLEYQYNKFCGLSINYDGTISIGESIECKVIGTLDDSLNTIFNNLKELNSLSCNKCGGFDNVGFMEKLNIDVR